MHLRRRERIAGTTYAPIGGELRGDAPQTQTVIAEGFGSRNHSLLGRVLDEVAASRARAALAPLRVPTIVSKRKAERNATDCAATSTHHSERVFRTLPDESALVCGDEDVEIAAELVFRRAIRRDDAGTSTVGDPIDGSDDVRIACESIELRCDKH